MARPKHTQAHFYGSSKDTHPHGGTPDHIIEQLTAEFGQLYDPCPNDFIECGLIADWASQPHTVFCNPPYTRGVIGTWVEKCYEEYEQGATVILLIPAYTDTSYFHDFIYHHAEIRFIRGRLKFKGYNRKSASFPSMLCIFRGEE